jgi:cyclopropane fatty-acyl-phospholipid synthase-like methyltransferase
MQPQSKSWAKTHAETKLKIVPRSYTPSWFEELFHGIHVAGEIELPGGRIVATGEGPPRFRITVHRQALLRRPHDELSLGQAYVDGELDLDGDMLAILEVRKQLKHRFRVGARLRFLADLLLLPATRAHKKAIDRHYNLGNDFYLRFLDSVGRFYSHCLFERDDQTLEQAAERKLERTFQALDLRPGMRLLEIGAGWGGTLEYCCRRGVKVTGLTLYQDSYNYVQAIIQRNHFDAKVLLQDFLTYQPDEPYDAMVIYGVIEHIPEYRRLFARAWSCLKPGGKIYLDGSATREKHSLSQFARRYIWQGNSSCMCLQDVIQEALYYGFNIVEVKDESHDYELTMLHWARRLDRHRDEIVKQWGERLYRMFRLYLWAGIPAFRDDQLQAYHLVARRGAGMGPRPGLARRIARFIQQLV